MDHNPYRDDDDTGQPDTYWRRRIATLAVGLGLLGLLAWAFSGGGGKSAGTAAQSSPPSGTLSAAADPSASVPASPWTSASAGASASVPGLARSGLPSANTSAKASAAARTRRVSAKPTAGATSAQITSGVEPDGRCSPSAVVLSVFSSSHSYPASQDPEFGVDAVSTASSTCTFDLGPAQLHLVVMSAGRVIWDSADCGHGGGGRLSKLTRGVPVQETFTWNRAITLPSCVTLASSARPGSYAAQARTATIASGTYSFKLVR